MQLRAAGALDEKFPDVSRQQLQIAALHQMNVFLCDPAFIGFRRPAFELLMAGHTQAMTHIRMDQLKDKILSRDIASLIEFNNSISSRRQDAKNDLVVRERLWIFDGARKIIFNTDLPISERNFDLVRIPETTLIDEADLSDSSFLGSEFKSVVFLDVDLSRAFMAGCNLSKAVFEFGYLGQCCLDFSDCGQAEFNYIPLTGSKLRAANFIEAKFKGGSLRQCDFSESDLSYANLENIDAGDANFQGATLFHANLRKTNLANLGVTVAKLVDSQATFFDGTDLTDACAEGADLRGIDPSRLKMCNDMTFDRTTKFSHPERPPFAELTDEEWHEASQAWTQRGARFVEQLSPWPSANATLPSLSRLIT